MLIDYETWQEASRLGVTPLDTSEGKQVMYGTAALVAECVIAAVIRDKIPPEARSIGAALGLMTGAFIYARAFQAEMISMRAVREARENISPTF